jgi:hypothetical protein
VNYILAKRTDNSLAWIDDSFLDVNLLVLLGSVFAL